MWLTSGLVYAMFCFQKLGLTRNGFHLVEPALLAYSAWSVTCPGKLADCKNTLVSTL